uniref:Uncharacterized protein LOC111109579 n=1 Tax=Crassostrea virginica TaxID=6565 RepID=A0A8B8BFA0_CRAVI|nr:uncharacterized protein LOC111109579 [Crassostrea virginica]
MSKSAMQTELLKQWLKIILEADLEKELECLKNELLKINAEKHRIPPLWEAFYEGMCLCVGTPTEVRIRREVANIHEVVFNSKLIMEGIYSMMTGSRRDGFRLKTSDEDNMIWVRDHKVICNHSQISLYNKTQHTVILMECENLPPGFSKLKLMTLSRSSIMSSIVIMNNAIYVSSRLFRAKYLISHQKDTCSKIPVKQHGPCATVYYDNLEIEVDYAHCLRSHYWPNGAIPWIQRCQLKKWPPDYVLSSILHDGFHMVPISSSPLNLECDCEWRISFSRAEQILVSSMNHCQLLCYGLLKIYLKEVINTNENEACLCSYFMKTIVFWVIQNHNHMAWVPENLLECLWICFKLLLSSVNRGECPNFFIPQNNMFRVKVVGHTQFALFDQLFGLYCKGSSCLLASSTIRKYLHKAILNKTLTFKTDEGSVVNSCRLDICLFREVGKHNGITPKNFKEFINVFNTIEEIQSHRLSSYQTLIVQYLLCKSLQRLSWFLLGKLTEKMSNRKRAYSLKIMRRATKIGCASEVLNLAMLYYRTCHYEQSLQCCRRAKDIMSKPYIMYLERVNEQIYISAMAGLSHSDRMKKSLIWEILLDKQYVFINELVPEQLACEENAQGFIHIPPLVMLHMLFVLNHHRLGDTVRTQQSIQDLHTFLLDDNGTHIQTHYKDISWQILAICQQTCGDYVGSLKSFKRSLQQTSRSHAIQKATILRILINVFQHNRF